MAVSLFLPIFVTNTTILNKILEYIFHEIPPIPMMDGIDHNTMIMNVIGEFGVFLFFLLISILCFAFSKTITPKEAYKQRIFATYLLAGAFFFCAISRGLNVLALWHNYYFLNGLFKLCTIVMALILIGYVPYLLRSIKSYRQLEALKESMQETSKKVDQLKDVSNKVLQKDI